MTNPPRNVNCQFAFKCSVTWRDLSEIENTYKVRYCTECETAVHLCLNEREFEEHAVKGHCVAYLERTSDENARLSLQDIISVGLAALPAKVPPIDKDDC